VEKPEPENAPSTLAVVGRYVLEPEIFNHLRATQIGTGNEIQLTDGIAALIEAKRKVFAHLYEGDRYDCGHKSGMFQATVAYGLKYHHFVIDPHTTATER
jgi:UTP--glucose-1-phosphate uridylyltransferase